MASQSPPLIIPTHSRSIHSTPPIFHLCKQTVPTFKPTMQYIFSVGCLLALLQTVVSTPVLATRADVVAHAGKGKSDSKCYGMLTGFCGGYDMGLGLGLGLDSFGLFGMSPMLNYGMLNPYSSWGMGYPYLGGGLFKKDASDAQHNTHDHSA
ncbi:hypothetical protein PtB15_8B364 [Puccinia triticina]|nr:hypothetical protein PtB15_8B364 [Puccinia triticina]